MMDEMDYLNQVVNQLDITSKPKNLEKVFNNEKTR